MDRPSPAGGRRQEGGERGKLGPKDGLPYHTANRPPVSNQRLPEILDGHPPGVLRLNTGRMHLHRRRLRLGTRRGEGALHQGRVRPSSSWLPELLRPGKAQNAGATKSAFCGLFVEYRKTGTTRNAGHVPYRAAGSLSRVDRESSASPSPLRNGTSEPEQETTSARLYQGGN